MYGCAAMIGSAPISIILRTGLIYLNVVSNLELNDKYQQNFHINLHNNL